MNRQDVALQHEGTLIDYAGRVGRVLAGEHARALIDGTANALLRLEGAEACAPYFFALSDRVCGGIRSMTVSPAAVEVPAPPPDPAPPAPAAAMASTESDAVADEDAAPGEPAIEEEPPLSVMPPRSAGWQQAVAALAIMACLALAWRAGFAAGRAW
jgi:hypothetical protein